MKMDKSKDTSLNVFHQTRELFENLTVPQSTSTNLEKELERLKAENSLLKKKTTEQNEVVLSLLERSDVKRLKQENLRLKNEISEQERWESSILEQLHSCQKNNCYLASRISETGCIWNRQVYNTSGKDPMFLITDRSVVSLQDLPHSSDNIVYQCQGLPHLAMKKRRRK